MSHLHHPNLFPNSKQRCASSLPGIGCVSLYGKAFCNGEHDSGGEGLGKPLAGKMHGSQGLKLRSNLKGRRSMPRGQREDARYTALLLLLCPSWEADMDQTSML